MLNLAITANKNGDYFPIWGTCLGLEVMIMALTKNPLILNKFKKDYNIRHSIVLSNLKQSKVFKDMPE